MLLHERVIDATVAVPDPINFCSDPARHLAAALQRYVGRCIRGAYVVRIQKVLRRSKCHLVATSPSGGGYIDVQFLAAVVVFSQWDILVGVEIVQREQAIVGVFTAPVAKATESAAASAVVTIHASALSESLAVGQRVPVRVLAVVHPPTQAQASVVGMLLVCDQEAPTYRLRGALDPAAAAALAPLVAGVDAELQERARLLAGPGRARLWFFEGLLHSFSGRPAGADQALPAGEGLVWEGPPSFAPNERAFENVVELIRKAAVAPVDVGGCWTRPLAFYRSSPLAARVADPGAEFAAGIVDSKPLVVFAEFLKNIYSFLCATRELAEMYDTEQLGAHENLWAAMRSAQRAPRA